MEQAVVGEAAIPLPALRVEDAKLRLPPRWTESVAGDRHRRPLADNVAPEPDPRSAVELEAESGGFGDGCHEAGGQPGRLQRDENRLRTASERGEAPETIGHAGRARSGIRTRRQIDDEDVDRPTGEERAGD